MARQPRFESGRSPFPVGCCGASLSSARGRKTRNRMWVSWYNAVMFCSALSRFEGCEEVHRLRNEREDEVADVVWKIEANIPCASTQKESIVSTPTSAGEPQRREKEDGIRRAMGWVVDTALEGVHIEVARRYEDYRRAFRIVHDSFVELGYIQRQPQEMWFQPHHCNGRTTVLIAKRAGRVVGTVSIFHDGATGLPVERVYPEDASSCRSDGSVFEIGSLAVAPEERGCGLAVLVQTAALYYGSRIGGAMHCLITVPPNRGRYYEALFGFFNIRQDRAYHGFQRPAVLMRLDMKRFDEWARVYPDPPGGWHTVRSLMHSPSFPRTDFAMRAQMSPVQLEELLPAVFVSEE